MLGKSKKMEAIGPETTALVAAESAAYKSKTLQQRKLDEKDRLWCDFCNKPRHTRETCWKLNGRPPQKGNKGGPKSGRGHAIAHEANNNILNKEKIRLINT